MLYSENIFNKKGLFYFIQWGIWLIISKGPSIILWHIVIWKQKGKILGCNIIRAMTHQIYNQMPNELTTNGIPERVKKMNDHQDSTQKGNNVANSDISYSRLTFWLLPQVKPYIFFLRLFKLYLKFEVKRWTIFTTRSR